MFCPRCGSPNSEQTKFCRQCGLGLSQVSTYVSTGGTSPLVQPQTSSSPSQGEIGHGLFGWMTPKQQLVFTILLLVFAPAIFGIFGEVIGLEKLAEALAGMSGVLMPIGIVLAVFRYKAKKRQLRQQQMMQWEQRPQPILQTQPQAYHPPLSPPPTNPIATPVRGSITEDETQHLPERRK